MKTMQTDTIAAIATPLGESALGIIRISGPAVYRILKKVFRPFSRIDITKIRRRSVYYGYIVNSKKSLEVDEVMLTVMPSPKSYTKEDTAEISCHGNPIILQEILNILIKAGARMAGPGEFTKRAFLNGRISLSQAEAVMEIINARTKESVYSALQDLKGSLSKQIKELQKFLEKIITQIEANIDFPEEDIKKLDIHWLYKELEDLKGKLTLLIRSYRQGRILKYGIPVAIIGRTNAGKSSLFNIFTNSHTVRALVTPVPGTTRDAIEGYITLQGKTLRIIDTAGIKIPQGIVERESIKATRKYIKKAEINILLLDGTKPFITKDLDVKSVIGEKPVIIVVNKIDLKQKISIRKVEKYFPSKTILKISCKNAQGIEGLKENLIKLTTGLYKIPSSMEPVITNIRHKDLLKKAYTSIKDALIAINNKLSPEFIAEDLYQALEALEEITGEHITGNILNNIFSRFCIGK